MSGPEHITDEPSEIHLVTITVEVEYSAAGKTVEEARENAQSWLDSSPEELFESDYAEVKSSKISKIVPHMDAEEK